MATHGQRVGTTVVLTALIVGGITVPAYAEGPPGGTITAVPDAGSRPATYGDIPLLPVGALAVPPTLPATPLEVLRAQIDAATVETQVLSERINELKAEHAETQLSLAWAEHGWTEADAKLKQAREAAAAAATDAYMSAHQLPPGFQSGSTLRDMQLFQPPSNDTFSEATAYELERAVAAEQAAAASLDEARQADKAAADNLAITTTAYEQRDKARLLLQERFVVLQTEEERKREQEEGKLPGDYDPGKSNKDLAAHPDARKVVEFALKQLGKPYKFSEEGPDFFDCSGLTWAGYRRVSVYLPRVSKDQYYATRHKEVDLDALLPGDLLFYARDKSDWKTIHHVMIYLGDGRVVHATGSGDKVKISRINLGAGSPVDFATRVIDAVRVTPATTQS